MKKKKEAFLLNKFQQNSHYRSYLKGKQDKWIMKGRRKGRRKAYWKKTQCNELHFIGKANEHKGKVEIKAKLLKTTINYGK